MGAAGLHTFKNFLPVCFPVLFPAACLPPGGGVRLEPLSLRAEPEGTDGSSWGWAKLFHKVQDSREQLFPVSLRGGGRDRDEPPGKGYSVHI